jgi:hypothetical protein
VTLPKIGLVTPCTFSPLGVNDMFYTPSIVFVITK